MLFAELPTRPSLYASGANLLTLDNPGQCTRLAHIEHEDQHLVIATKVTGGAIHDLNHAPHRWPQARLVRALSVRAFNLCSHFGGKITVGNRYALTDFEADKAPAYRIRIGK